MYAEFSDGSIQWVSSECEANAIAQQKGLEVQHIEFCNN